MKPSKLNIVLWKEGKYHVAQCLDNNVSSFGKTKDQALKNVKEALELNLENNKNHIPKINHFVLNIEQDEDDIYIGSIPDVPSCNAQGETHEELLKNLKEVIALCLRNKHSCKTKTKN